MPSKLTKLIVDRVDLVDRGANPDAHVVLFKRAEPEGPVSRWRQLYDALTRGESVTKMDFNELLQLQQFQSAVWGILDMCMTLEDAIYSSMYADGDRAQEIRDSIQQFSEAVDEALAAWLKGEPVAQRDASAVVEKMRDRFRQLVQEVGVADNDHVKKVDEPAAPAPPDPTPSPAPSPDPAPAPAAQTEEEIVKGLPQHLREKLARVDEADEAIRKANEDRDRERERAELLEFSKRADDEFGAYPGTAEERARVLMAVRTLPDAERATLTTMLKSGQAALTSMTGPTGGLGGEADVVKRVEAMAEELLKKGEAKTREQAIAKVLQQNPKLYDEYNKK